MLKEKDLKIYENIAKDREFISKVEMKIATYISQNNILEEEKQSLTTIENRLMEIYQLLSKEAKWEGYEKLIREYDEISLEANKIMGE